MDSKTIDSSAKGTASTAPPNGEIIVSFDNGTANIVDMGVRPIKKHLGVVSIISFSFVICNSWAGVSGSIQVALLQGGPVTLIYTVLISSVAFACIASTMAELVSVYPTAGGQYHFVSILAPDRYRRALSYACGLLSILSWISIGASVAIITAQQIEALVALYHPNYRSPTWHVFLIYEAVLVWTFLFNLLVLKKAPWTHNFGFMLTIVLFLATLIVTLARAHPLESNDFVWKNFINYTGWPDGVCFITGLSTSCYMFAGLDASMHMAEEVTNAARTVPKAIMSAVTIGFLTAFPYSIVTLYAITDMDAIINSTIFIPVTVQIQNFRSVRLTYAFTIVGTIMSFFVLHAILETTTRMTWSFARDNGLMGSKHLAKVHEKFQIPVWALVSSSGLLAICGCIYMASSTAFNALIGASVVLQLATYSLPAALLLYRRRSEEFLPANRPFKVPTLLGYFTNTVVCCFGIITIIFFNFPSFLPVTASSMNYTCVILGIAFLLGLVNWFIHARKCYHGPYIEFQD